MYDRTGRTLLIPLLCILLAAAASGPLRAVAAERSLTGIDPGEFVGTRALVIFGIAAAGAAWSWEETDERHGVVRSALDRSFLDGAFDIGNAYGGGWVVGGGSLGLMAVGSLAGDDASVALGADLTRAYLWSGMITGVIKHSVGRRRPSGGPLSFPSGHTTSAFSTVPVLWDHLGWKAGVAASTLAVLTAFGRMEENRHYLSDVIAGAAIGWVTGSAVVADRRAARPHLVVAGGTVGVGWGF